MDSANITVFRIRLLLLALGLGLMNAGGGGETTERPATTPLIQNVKAATTGPALKRKPHSIGAFLEAHQLNF